MIRQLFIAVLLSALISGVAVGADTLPTPTPAPANVPSAQQSANLNRLKTRGASEIDRRLAALQAALLKVQSNTTLSTADQQAYVKLVQDQIDSLTTLKSKLAAETSLDKARVDVQAILTDYRNYGLVVVKARLIAVTDRTVVSGKKYQQLQAKLQEKVTQAKAQGYDVAELQASLDSMKQKLTEAQAKYDSLPSKALILPPADYPASHKALRDYREALKAVRATFKSAHDDAEVVIDGLKKLKKASASSSPSPSVSPTASASPATP